MFRARDRHDLSAWKAFLLLALLVASMIGMALALGGCGAQIEGLRFAPDETQKQAAQASRDLAVVAATTGLPPRSPAARRMAESAGTATAYVGTPSKPVNLEDLIPAGVSDAWATIQERAKMIELRQRVQARASDIQTRQLADLVTTVKARATVSSRDVLSKLDAIARFVAMSKEMADVVPVPAEPSITDAEAARMTRLDEAIRQINEAASTAATARPTAGDVADVAISQIQQTSDKARQVAGSIGQVLTDWGIPIGGILAGIGGGGVLAWRKNSQAKAAQQTAQNIALSSVPGEVVARLIDGLTASAPPAAPASPTPAASAPAAAAATPGPYVAPAGTKA